MCVSPGNRTIVTTDGDTNHSAFAEKPPGAPDPRDISVAASKQLRVAYVARSFLDYRLPVYGALDELTGGSFYLLYSAEYVPERAQRKVQQLLGERAIGLRGECRLGPEDAGYMANRNVSIRFQPGLFARIRSLRPDVLVCDGFFKWTFPSLVYRAVFGTPLVILYERTFHTERRAQWFRTAYRRLALRYTDAMSCNGQLCKEYSVWLGMPPHRITTGHMAADVELLAQGTRQVAATDVQRLRGAWGAKAREHETEGGTVFLYVGRLIERKGITELLNAWTLFEASAESEPPDSRAVLVIVGEGPERVSLEQSAKSRGLNVRFVGSVDYDQITSYYAAADVFVIPTLEDNWSLVVPEAMACRLPILCSRYNGCWPELVQQGRNGWVFDPLDPEDSVRGLVEAAGPSRRILREMGASSQKIVEEFSPCRAAEAILEACEIAVAYREGA